MPSSQGPAPSSFYVVRLISKAPCMVLRLGFPIGTPAQARNQIVEELQGRILQLRFPHRVQSKEATPKVKRKTFGSSSPSKSPPMAGAPPTLSDTPCPVGLHKPLEKLLALEGGRCPREAKGQEQDLIGPHRGDGGQAEIGVCVQWHQL
nr:KICSTOR complex protein SZT2-like [Pelodiscus sinensis]|eukprot:XP_014437186.1 KICSTOR complex protein SZT2-like [Pelodiscus sinensis]